MELLPYNWEWNGISRMYANLTASCGNIHHVAWRAKNPRCGASLQIMAALKFCTVAATDLSVLRTMPGQHCWALLCPSCILGSMHIGSTATTSSRACTTYFSEAPR